MIKIQDMIKDLSGEATDVGWKLDSVIDDLNDLVPDIYDTSTEEIESYIISTVKELQEIKERLL